MQAMQAGPRPPRVAFLAPLLAACALAFATYLPLSALAGHAWVVVVLVDVLLMAHLVSLHRHSGAVLIALIFLFTYYLAPLPYLLLQIPIVPYTDHVSVAEFTRTWLVMSTFLAWLCCFSALGAYQPAHSPRPALGEGHLQRFNVGAVTHLYWVFATLVIALTFKGEAIVNVSGSDNYDAYMGNLKAQSGSLEYFLAVMAVGHLLRRTAFDRTCYAVCGAYYLYFCFTRGYRVQMLEMGILLATLHLSTRLTLKNVLLASVAGFVLLQAHGLMKHGASDLVSLFTLMAGDEIRSNQTEVFYTTNNVVNPVLNGQIPWSERLSSLAVALLACVFPGSALPTTWHTTLSAQSLTQLPGGGGGIIAGHYFYWGAQLGVAAGAFILAAVFRLHTQSTSDRTRLLTSLLIATSPRWVAYEPVANFFRLGLFFLIAYEVFAMFSLPRQARGARPARLPDPVAASRD